MKIKSIQIKNYRSIEDLTLSFNPIGDNSCTYGLIGVNEAGKSSILKALALKDGLIENNLKDFRDKRNIEITYTLNPNEKEISEYIEIANAEEPAINIKDIDFKEMVCVLSIDKANINERIFSLNIRSEKNDEITKLESKLKVKVVDQIPKSIFWTAESKYLIDKPINQLEFASSPESISIPLKNCFSLAGIQNIKEYITNLSGTPDEEELENILGEKVTEHIRLVWPNHPILITFRIAQNSINFHVKDEGSKGKAKTADQRSDGFKQFVSFLLTISAQSKNEELSDSILLLDEPETHLHPQAQEYLLNELIKITKNDKNNICFFATHSLFMIDKGDLSRNYRVHKEFDKTVVESFAEKKSSYSRVAYEVYGIPTTDLHNELYGLLQEQTGLYRIDEFDNYLQNTGLPLNPYIKNGTKREDQQITLPTKIRNIIHHPENTSNSYSKEDLANSIAALLNLQT